jgi:stress response protein YsnF
VVGKRARITEEVRVGKQASEREQTVRDNVRETKVDVQRTANSGYAGPERRRSRSSSYKGTERRAAMGR